MRSPAIPALLSCLMAGCIVTPMRWGPKYCSSDHARSADYILSLKSNHPTLFQQVEQWFQQMQADASTPREHTTESGHHRIDTRTVWTPRWTRLLPLSSRRVGRTAKYCHRGTDSSVMEQNHPRSAVLPQQFAAHSPIANPFKPTGRINLSWDCRACQLNFQEWPIG